MFILADDGVMLQHCKSALWRRDLCKILVLGERIRDDGRFFHIIAVRDCVALDKPAETQRRSWIMLTIHL